MPYVCKNLNVLCIDICCSHLYRFVVGASASFTFFVKKSMIKNTKHLYGQIVEGVSSGYAVRVG